LAGAVTVTSITSVALAAPPSCSTWPDCFYPLLSDETANASRSVGDVLRGFLVGGKRLRESDALGFLPATKVRDLAFGTAELVELIEHAARELHRSTGTKLWVGNLSRRGGGDIQHSVSHNSGRDADVAFCYVDKQKRPIDPTELDAVRGNGRSVRGRYFDVARSWIVVKALLDDNGPARVQFVFVAAWLKRMLLAHARAIGEPAALLARAHDALQHPVGSAAHDDHFHVRLFCSARDIESGCVDGGSFTSSLPRHQRELALRTEAARKELSAAEPAARQRAIARLVLLRARSEGPRLLPLLEDPVAEVRWSAAAALGWLGQPIDVRALTERAKVEPSALVQAELTQSARLLRGAVATRLLSFGSSADGYLVRGALYGARVRELRLESEGAERDAIDRARAELLGATEAAVRIERMDPVEPLVDLLVHASPRVRLAAARALALITNYAPAAPWGADDADRQLYATAAKNWRSWIRAHGHGGRQTLLSAGFRAGRYRYEPHAPQSLYELVRALDGADHHAHNAERLLVRLTMHHRPEQLPRADACSYWLAWIIGHRSWYRVGMPVRPVSCAVTATTPAVAATGSSAGPGAAVAGPAAAQAAAQAPLAP
jgi:penicillin-insensitive murein endopeptidase